MLPWYVCENMHEHSIRIELAPEKIRPYVRQILEDGYTVVRSSVAPDVLNSANNAYFKFKERVKVFNPPTEDGRHRRLVNLHCAIPELVDLFSFNRATPILDYMFGAEASIYTSLFYEVGSSQDLHRDTPYFWTNPGYRYFGYWVGLEDVDQRNGCLQVVPKSHLVPEEDRADIALMFYGELNKVPHADERLWKEYQMRAQQASISAGLSVLDVCVSAGDTIIWHPHTLHGGRFILDQSRSRLSLVIHTTPRNQAVFHNEGFFNPEVALSEFYSKRYHERNGRSYVPYENVSFGHVFEVPAKNLEG